MAAKRLRVEVGGRNAEEDSIHSTLRNGRYVWKQCSGYQGQGATQTDDNMHVLRGKGKPITEVKQMRADAAYELLMAPARTVRQTTCGHLTAQA